MSTIANGADRPLFAKSGDVPDVSGALQSYYQEMVFKPLTKTVTGFQLVETALKINFRGVLQPLSPQRLVQKPEGQRQWRWVMLHADPCLSLKPDDCISYNGLVYRVMAQTDFSLYGYQYYELVENYTGDGL